MGGTIHVFVFAIAFAFEDKLAKGFSLDIMCVNAGTLYLEARRRWWNSAAFIIQNRYLRHKHSS